MRQGLTLLFIAIFVLSACESVGSAVGSMGDGMKNVGNRIAEIDLTVPAFGRDNDQMDGKNTRNVNFTTISAEKTCPPVTLVPDLKHLHQFSSTTRQTDNTLISKAEISRLSAHCTVNAYNVAVEINMVFTGSIGPRAKVHATDEPNFSYPYFIALKTENGDIIAREAFAATLSYKGEQIEAMTTESVRQIIPLTSEGRSTIQEILIGFQLEQSELDYNRALNTSRTLTPPTATSLTAPDQKSAPTGQSAVADDTAPISYSVFGD